MTNTPVPRPRHPGQVGRPETQRARHKKDPDRRWDELKGRK